jgi:hypothetical protein
MLLSADHEAASVAEDSRGSARRDRLWPDSLILTAVKSVHGTLHT